MVKWPIAKVLVLFCPDVLRNASKINSNNNTLEKLKKAKALVWDVADTKNKTEILLRYHQTPAVISAVIFNTQMYILKGAFDTL